jgi:hypothetical protein
MKNFKPKTRNWAINPGNDCELYDPTTTQVLARFEYPDDARLACAAPAMLAALYAYDSPAAFSRQDARNLAHAAIGLLEETP